LTLTGASAQGNVGATGAALLRAISGVQARGQVGVLDLFYWTTIDDGQVPDWQDMQNAQVPNWGDIENSQLPDWEAVKMVV
jgi:hypothetical protein